MIRKLVFHQVTNVARYDKHRAKNVEKSLSQECRIASNHVSTEKSSHGEKKSLKETLHLSRRTTFFITRKQPLYAECSNRLLLNLTHAISNN